MTRMIPVKLLYYFLFFSEMSFLGWIIESTYRSVREKKIVNSGFLSGPFIPIYGFGAVFITVVAEEARSLPSAIAWVAFLLSPTALEYVSSLLLEKLFKLKLWDYSDRRFNLHGRICLQYALYWAVLAVVLVLFIEPHVYARIEILGLYLAHFVAGGFFSYFIFDTLQSVKSIINFAEFKRNMDALIDKQKEFHASFEAEAGKDKLPAELRRLLKPLKAFPKLRSDFQKKSSIFPERIRKQFEKKVGRTEKKKEQGT
jgi:uncharacterized membrane protein